MPPSRKSTWEKIKEVPALTASIIAVIAAAIGVVSWIGTYFATRHQLEIVKCISDKNEDLLAKQIEQATQYAQYIQFHVEINRLKDNGAEFVSVAQKEADAKLAWEGIAANRNAAEDIIAFLKSGGCGTL